MNIQNEIAATVIGNRMSDMANRNRRDMILQWLKRLLIALLMVLGPSLTAEHEDPPPIPLGIVAPANGAQFGLGVPITFQRSAASWGVTPYWHFGDGSSTSAGTCTHVYAAPGTYSARLQYPRYQQGSSQNGEIYPEHNFYVSVTVQARPVISSFYASPVSINRGAGTTLIWGVSGTGVSFSLSPDIGT